MIVREKKRCRKSKALFDKLCSDGMWTFYIYIYKHFDFCFLEANTMIIKYQKNAKTSKLKNVLSVLALRND